MRAFLSLSAACTALAALSLPLAAGAGDDANRQKLIERGRYIVQIGGCNDCHTPAFAMTDGGVAEKDWLTGDRLGFHGPWGTTYPANLRRYFAGKSEEEWLRIARDARYRPPMPSVVLRTMSDEDLRALYHYVRFLGAAGEDAPAYVPPGAPPAGPVVLFPMPPG